MARTQDPEHYPVHPGRRGRAKRPVLEVLFHPQIAMLGAVARPWGSRSRAAAGDTIVLGRNEPLFEAADGVERPLGDPCVSEAQLVARWVPKRRRFEVRRHPNGPRSLKLYDSRFKALPEGVVDLPPGGAVAIENRMLLRFDIRAVPDPALPSFELSGRSAAVQTVREHVARLARSTDTVLLSGETGTGKEVVSRALHDASPRSGEPFLAVNCAAIPKELVGAELFGHAKGAFSSADIQRDGLFLAARGGTLLLDEVAEIPLDVQATLLRVLQEKEVRPIGESRPRAVRARVVAASHRDLRREVLDGRFRQDLLYRLDKGRIHLWPLRDRPEDIPHLIRDYLLARLEGNRLRGATGPEAGLARLLEPPTAKPPALGFDWVLQLLQHRWPGNVRELFNLLGKAVNLDRGEGAFWAPVEGFEPNATDTTAGTRAGTTDNAPDGTGEASPAPVRVPLRQRSTGEIEEALAAEDWVVSRAAKRLSAKRDHVYSEMRARGLPVAADLEAAVIEEAVTRCDGDLMAAARVLRVSYKGLQNRVRALGWVPVPPGD